MNLVMVRCLKFLVIIDNPRVALNNQQPNRECLLQLALKILLNTQSKLLG